MAFQMYYVKKRTLLCNAPIPIIYDYYSEILPDIWNTTATSNIPSRQARLPGSIVMLADELRNLSRRKRGPRDPLSTTDEKR